MGDTVFELRRRQAKAIRLARVLRAAGAEAWCVGDEGVRADTLAAAHIGAASEECWALVAEMLDRPLHAVRARATAEAS